MSVNFIDTKGVTLFQRDIIKECLTKGRGGLSLPMGSGKTLISLKLATRYYKETGRPSLVVASKTLIPSWIDEIDKFLHTDKYIVLHDDYLPHPDRITLPPKTRFVLTTPGMLTQAYKKFHIEPMVVYKEVVSEFPMVVVNRYLENKGPIRRFEDPTIYQMLYGSTWSGIFIDEVQKYTNVSTSQCRSMISIDADHRWVLSGTMFYEPKVERIMGYHLLVGYPFPRTLPEATTYVKSEVFPGYEDTLVHRTKNENFQVEPKLNVVLEEVPMYREEIDVYLSMKNIMKMIRKEINNLKMEGNAPMIRKFSAYKLACLTYLRQIIVVPMVPIASIMVDFLTQGSKSHLTSMITEELKTLNLTEWLEDENNACSSRITKVRELLDRHTTERVVVFTSFRCSIDVMLQFLPTDREVLTITSKMSQVDRGAVIDKFNEVDNSVLVLTYEIGAEGLNLQSCSTIILVDLWWNSGKMQQAVARVMRYGQQSPIVNAYFLTSNTGLENAILNKSDSKVSILSEIKSGKPKTFMTKLTMDKIIAMVDTEDNIRIATYLNKKLFG